jgi:hypothetical protein
LFFSNRFFDGFCQLLGLRRKIQQLITNGWKVESRGWRAQCLRMLAKLLGAPRGASIGQNIGIWASCHGPFRAGAARLNYTLKPRTPPAVLPIIAAHPPLKSHEWMDSSHDVGAFLALARDRQQRGRT